MSLFERVQFDWSLVIFCVSLWACQQNITTLQILATTNPPGLT